ncbi:hypothetical protein D1007_20604 [Hordeum vulgare]|nr:hypothetical protein D1007_20604 [Hordeum vulgare]
MLEFESPLVPDNASYAELSSEIVKELEDAPKKLDDILEEECRNLFSRGATRVFSHLFLRDPIFKFEEVMDPVHEESCGDLAAAVEGHLNMLLGNFFCGDSKKLGEEPRVVVLK